MCFNFDERFQATVTSIVKVAGILRSMLAKYLNYSNQVAYLSGEHCCSLKLVK